MVRWRSNRHQWPNKWKRRNRRSIAITATSAAHIASQVSVLPNPPPRRPKRGKPEAAEDQRPAQHGVDGDPGDAQPQDDPRPFERRDEIAQQLEQQPRRGAPHVGAQERLALARQIRRDAEGAHDAADVPQDQPVGRQHRGNQPQAGAEGAAHVAHRVEALPERGRHHRRGGDDQPEHQQVEGEGQVERQRRGGKLGCAEPAHQQHVGRLDDLLGEVGEDQRPGERQRRAQLVAPRAAVVFP